MSGQLHWFIRGGCNLTPPPRTPHDYSHRTARCLCRCLSLRKQMPLPLTAKILGYLYPGEPFSALRCEAQLTCKAPLACGVARLHRSPAFFSSWLQTPYLYTCAVKETLRGVTSFSCRVSVDLRMPSAQPFAAQLRTCDRYVQDRVTNCGASYVPCVDEREKETTFHIQLQRSHRRPYGVSVHVRGAPIHVPPVRTSTSSYMFDALHDCHWISLTLRPRSIVPATARGGGKGVALDWQVGHVELRN